MTKTTSEVKRQYFFLINFHVILIFEMNEKEEKGKEHLKIMGQGGLGASLSI